MERPRAWAELDLGHLEQNLTAIRGAIGSDPAIMLVVKADAYGHGAVEIARAANRQGVAAFGVGTVAEAVELLDADVLGRTLVLGAIVDGEAPEAIERGIELGVHSSDRCQMLADAARRLGRPARVHLNVDTGMGRLGAAPVRALDVLEQIAREPWLELVGVMTHVASPRGNLDPDTADQQARFERFLTPARARGLLRGWVHMANSASIFTGLRPLYDAVRPGIAALGMLPADDVGPSRLQPVLSLRSQVIFFKDVEAGTPIGYGGTWRARRRSRIATLPLGYNDGVPWRVGNGRQMVLVRGHRAPIVGRVSMDYTTIDVTDVPGVEIGDVVTLVGRDGAEQVTVADMAREAGTIAYEVTCSIGRRVPRVVVEHQTLENRAEASFATPDK
ncbi:MAG: alanine racemase [Planctomycetota bacterium]